MPDPNKPPPEGGGCTCTTCTQAREAAKERVKGAPPPSQISVWHEPLLERGFEMVSEFVNSNTGNILRCYHLDTGKLLDAEKAAKAKPKSKKEEAVEKVNKVVKRVKRIAADSDPFA